MSIEDLRDDLEQLQARERDEFEGQVDPSEWMEECPRCHKGPRYVFLIRGEWICGICYWEGR